MIKDHQSESTQYTTRKENRQSHDGGSKRTPAKERIETDHNSQEGRERRYLIGKKSHHDGIIIEKRNDPRKIRRVKAGKPI
jgi:hypothetical protein